MLEIIVLLPIAMFVTAIVEGGKGPRSRPTKCYPNRKGYSTKTPKWTSKY